MALIKNGSEMTTTTNIPQNIPTGFNNNEVEAAAKVPCASDIPRRSSWGEPLTSWEIQRERQIQVSGVIQAAVQAPVLQLFSTSYSEWWNLVQETAKNELKFIRENS